ncbi:MAG: CoA transferase [bacterium]
MMDNLTLSGLSVLDLGTRTSTAWCSRLLADFGAEVIAVESKTRHPLRQHGPCDSQGESIPARYFLINKKWGAFEQVSCLISEADIILTSSIEGDWSAENLSAQNEQALVCGISAYGLSGALCGFIGNDLTACAASGWAWVNGLQGRPPLKSSGYQASYQAGTYAFGTLLAAVIEQLADGGSGQIIDISEREVLVSTSAPAPLRYQYSGFMWSRKPAVDVNEGPIPVKDGWFALTISRPAFWIKAMRLLGLPDLADDKELQQSGLRHKHKDRFVERVATAMKDWNRMDLFQALGEQRVIAGPALRMDELSDNPQFEGRGFLRESGDGVRYPGPFAKMSVSDWRTPKELGTVTSFTQQPKITVEPRRAIGGIVRKTGPLHGFRGLVLTQAWAGTYATELLALLGADVIQLETRGRLDSWRGSYQNPIPKNMQQTESAKHAWNCSPLYNAVNLNKRCITVDLSEPEGVELFKDLVVQTDFVAENFSPRVMGNLGIDYDSLKALKPDIVMASLSAYGAEGPWAHVPGIGGTIEPSSGMSALLGYKGEHPMNSGQMYPDPVAGLCGYSAILLALLHRDRTGQGQYIDLSMQEANFTFIGDAWLEYEINGTVREPMGNSHSGFAPCGIYPTAGEDNWIAISGETDAQWQAIVELLKLEPTENFDTNRQRQRFEEQLDEVMGRKTANLDRLQLSRQLQDAGVPAAAVLRPDEIAGDSDLRDRGHMMNIRHPETGAYWQSVLPAKFSRSNIDSPLPAPTQGQHSWEVFNELLAMEPQTYEQLCDREITGVGPCDKSSVANQA